MAIETTGHQKNLSFTPLKLVTVHSGNINDVNSIVFHLGLRLEMKKLYSIVNISRQLWILFFFSVACPENISLPTITGPVTCHLGNTCTSIDCCVSVPLIRKSFRMFLDLDVCSYKLRVGIESLQAEIPLFNYEWGKPQVFRLQGALQLQSVSLVKFKPYQ